MHPRLLLVAVQLLTLLPVGDPRRDERDGARSVGWFSVVGALIGGLAAFTWWTATLALPRLSAAAIAVAITVLLTGGRHEHGAARTADGVIAEGDQASRRAALRTAAPGTAGVLTLVLSLLLRVSLLASLPPTLGAGALVAVGALSRGALGIAGLGALPADEQRAPWTITGMRAAPAVISLLLALVVATATLQLAALPLVALGMLGARLVRGAATSRLGGFTDEVMGAVVVTVEVLGLLAVAIATGDLLS